MNVTQTIFQRQIDEKVDQLLQKIEKLQRLPQGTWVFAPYEAQVLDAIEAEFPKLLEVYVPESREYRIAPCYADRNTDYLTWQFCTRETSKRLGNTAAEKRLTKRLMAITGLPKQQIMVHLAFGKLYVMIYFLDVTRKQNEPKS